LATRAPHLNTVVGFWYLVVGNSPKYELPKTNYHPPKADSASDRNRTGDLLITNQLLYQLSYAGGPTKSLVAFKSCFERTKIVSYHFAAIHYKKEKFSFCQSFGKFIALWPVVKQTLNF
jgi:hypothetical protein